MSAPLRVADFTPKKCGYRRRPPRIILHYTVNKNGEDHLRQRSMPLCNLTQESRAKPIAEDLIQRHSKYLEKLAEGQLENIVQRLLNALYPPAKEKEEEKVENATHGAEDENPQTAKASLFGQKESEKVDDDEEDLNKLSDGELATRKAKMDELFEANRKLPGDEGYEYDKEVDFGEVDDKMECGWDDEDDDDDDQW